MSERESVFSKEEWKRLLQGEGRRDAAEQAAQQMAPPWPTGATGRNFRWTDFAVPVATDAPAVRDLESTYIAGGRTLRRLSEMLLGQGRTTFSCAFGNIVLLPSRAGEVHASVARTAREAAAWAEARGFSNTQRSSYGCRLATGGPVNMLLVRAVGERVGEHGGWIIDLLARLEAEAAEDIGLAQEQEETVELEGVVWYTDDEWPEEWQGEEEDAAGEGFEGFEGPLDGCHCLHCTELRAAEEEGEEDE